MGFIKSIEISNPSPYERSDYVQLDLDKLGVPKALNEDSLLLYRIKDDGGKEPVLFQIDYPFGEKVGRRVITFLSNETPKGKDDYSKESASFQLIETSKKESLDNPHPGLKAECHFMKFNSEDKNGKFSTKCGKINGYVLSGVKLFNGSMEVYFRLSAEPKSPQGMSYSGSASSINIPDVGLYTGCGEMLSPYWECPEKLWGKVNKIIFYNSPWEDRLFQSIDLIDIGYEIVWMNSGSVRPIVSLKSEPFTVTFEGDPFFSKTRVKVLASLYRIIYLYPEKDKYYYTEELFVLAEKENRYLNFRPYYFSRVQPENAINEVKRFDHIPDYFSLWKHFGPHHRGYGFASDVHTYDVKTKGDEISWHLYVSPNFRCIHYFMFEFNEIFDPFQKIGHSGWYERVFKPLRPKNLETCFPPLVKHEDYYKI